MRGRIQTRRNSRRARCVVDHTPRARPNSPVPRLHPLSLDHPAAGVARGGGETWLGRGGNAGRARGWNGRTAPAEMRTRSERRQSVRWLLLRADGARRKMQASSFARLCQNYGNERFQLVRRRSGEVCI